MTVCLERVEHYAHGRIEVWRRTPDEPWFVDHPPEPRGGRLPRPDACVVMFTGDRPLLDIDKVAPWAVDRHTARGRALGRIEARCYDESFRLENEMPVPNPYAVEARAIDGVPPKRPTD